MEININPIKKQTVSDDPELAKVLMGVNNDGADDSNGSDGAADDSQLQYEGMEPVEEAPAPAEAEPVPAPAAYDQPQVAPNYGGLDLESIKNSALQDLRPLVDKLNATNEEKFDIYLLLLRSSDDDTLIEPAYNAARAIEDESKRANALLDIIKEIDYFKSK